METGSDYRIMKLEKGPLQRFKNQNLILKKYGETGLQIYKAITGKRTAAELRKDLGVEPALFREILDFMRDAGMVELQSVKAHEPERGVETPEEELPPEEEKPGRTLEEIPPEEETSEEEKPPLEELPRRKKPAREEEEAKPEEAPPEEKAEVRAMDFEEIRPIEFGEEEKPKKKKPAEEEAPPEEEAPEEKEEAPQEEAPPEEKEEQPEEEIQPLSQEEMPEAKEEKISFEEEKPPEEEAAGLSPVEKIISDKYGDIGLRVYTLIDGQRTAEEIMKDTGLTEAKLVEILDFMDEQGIIKLDYPKGQPPAGAAAAPAEAAKEAGFVPMIEGEHAEETGQVPSPLEIPVRAPSDLVKSVQMKAKVMLKFGDRGSRILSQIDGKNDVIDLAMNLGLPLYTVTDVLKFMMEGGMIIMKPVPRADARKKYGDDGYAVYKRYGKEGLMLYELIGKELTIKQMADQITTDKAKIIDMFIFIHKVLGIELPIDKDVLAKQLGV
ncbi:MAG: hypothetical protein PHV13_01120 [Candidatus ainarchaeum sp.]|nr:hypothetical protein [Candidatus ainarchaeum sp.]